ncbi:MAG: hypothetical protein QXX99_06550 [Candidatus Bathyarchaeia archaeon]
MPILLLQPVYLHVAFLLFILLKYLKVKPLAIELPRGNCISRKEYALFPWLTVEGNIKYGLEEKGLSRDEIKHIVNKYVQMMGLKGFEHKFPKELSGGMK